MSKGWSWVLYLASVGLLTLTGACKSQHKAVKASKESKIEKRYGGIMVLYGVRPPEMPVDRKAEAKRLQVEVDSLQRILDRRKGVVIYGPPEMMEKRGRENRQIQNDIDSLKNTINTLNSEQD